MNFVTAIRTAFSKYADFNGRASRSEYWWFFLFTFLINMALEIASGLDEPDFVGSLVIAVISLAIVVPSLAVAARRLHDVNRSGWWQLISLTIIGLIPLIYWLVKKGTDGPNRFGDDPLSAVAPESQNIVT